LVNMITEPNTPLVSTTGKQSWDGGAKTYGRQM